MYIFFDILIKKKHILYLNFIRLRIYYSKKPQDIIKILKNICYFNGYNCSDEILTFLIKCFTIYPLQILKCKNYLSGNKNIIMKME